MKEINVAYGLLKRLTQPPARSSILPSRNRDASNEEIKKPLAESRRLVTELMGN
jgi:hypothetical protein